MEDSILQTVHMKLTGSNFVGRTTIPTLTGKRRTTMVASLSTRYDSLVQPSDDFVAR
jgi:hypothetical protein